MLAPVSAVWRMALGDFRDRARRPAYLVTLLVGIGLAWLALPASDARWTVLDVGGYRGVYTSGYVGTAAALASSMWLGLGGFFVVRGGVARDERSRLGRVLAATPIPTAGYLLAKFWSNALVLLSMAAVVAASALVLQLLRGESQAVSVVALALPFVVLTSPVLLATSALALVFDTSPVLRGGFGNIVWFVLAVPAAIAGQSASAPLGGLGVHEVVLSMAHASAQQGTEPPMGEFSLGLTYVDAPLRTFEWDGLDYGWDLLLGRAVLCCLAVGVAVLPALWFGRFDPARTRRQGPPEKPEASSGGGPVLIAVDERSPRTTAAGFLRREGGASLRGPSTGWGGGQVRLLVGEWRILSRGLPWWWWAGAAVITAAAPLLPRDQISVVLLALWIWPVLVWSRLGTQRAENDMEGLLRAFPRPRRRLVAEWLSGVGLSVVVGAGPALTMVARGEGPGLAAWAAGALFVPAAAFLLGVVSGSHRLFQVLHLILWFMVANGLTGLDVLGAMRVDGVAAGPSPILVSLSALALVMCAVAVEVVRSRGPGTGSLGRMTRGRSARS